MSIITKTSSTPESRRRSTYGDRAVVYVNDPLTTLIDQEYFNGHKVHSLEFVSSAWNKVCRAVNKLVAQELNTVLPGGYNISFSRKAGCNCGCSPGFVVKRHSKYDQPFLTGTDYWVNVEMPEDVITKFRQEWDMKFPKLLAQDVLKHSAAA